MIIGCSSIKSRLLVKVQPITGLSDSFRLVKTSSSAFEVRFGWSFEQCWATRFVSASIQVSTSFGFVEQVVWASFDTCCRRSVYIQACFLFRPTAHGVQLLEALWKTKSWSRAFVSPNEGGVQVAQETFASGFKQLEGWQPLFRLHF